MRSHVIRWLAVPALAAGAAFATPFVATTAFAQSAPPAQQPGGQIPSVGVTPVGTSPDDPNGGQWFVMNLTPGETGQAQARIANPADVTQKVTLSLADLDFSEDGTPSISSHSSDVGAWGRSGIGSLTIPAKSTATVPFTVAVPTTADPGDHVGALVVTGEPQTS